MLKLNCYPKNSLWHWTMSGMLGLSMGLVMGLFTTSGLIGCSKGEDEELPNVPRAASKPAYIPPLRPEVVASAPATKPALIPTTQGGKGPITRTVLSVPPKLEAITGQEQQTPSGLKFIEIAVGTGPLPKPGQQIYVDYTGWLTNGTEFDSSRIRPAAFDFVLGQRRVIDGWDEGVATMKVGGKRRLIVPPALGYKATASEKIPANSTLIFDVELLGVQE